MYAYFNCALIYSDKQDYDKAITDFSEYIKLSPNDPDGYQRRGSAYVKLSKNVAAQADFEKAKQLGYTGPQ